jgi:hypothetical protein
MRVLRLLLGKLLGKERGLLTSTKKALRAGWKSGATPPGSRERCQGTAAGMKSMPKFEYSKIDLNNAPRKSDDLDLLEAAGAQGWRLVLITPNNVAYLIREIEEPRTKRGYTRRQAEGNDPSPTNK